MARYRRSRPRTHQPISAPEPNSPVARPRSSHCQPRNRDSISMLMASPWCSTVPGFPPGGATPAWDAALGGPPSAPSRRLCPRPSADASLPRPVRRYRAGGCAPPSTPIRRARRPTRASRQPDHQRRRWARVFRAGLPPAAVTARSGVARGPPVPASPRSRGRLSGLPLHMRSAGQSDAGGRQVSPPIPNDRRQGRTVRLVSARQAPGPCGLIELAAIARSHNENPTRRRMSITSRRARWKRKPPGRSPCRAASCAPDWRVS